MEAKCKKLMLIGMVLGGGYLGQFAMFELMHS